MARNSQYGFYRDIVLNTDGSLQTGMTSSQYNQLVYNSNQTQFSIAVYKGQIPGYEPFSRYGKNPDIDEGSTPEDIWCCGGEYTGFPTETETMEIFSSSSEDTANGNGARTVTISNLLDENYNEMPPVTVTLNGTSSVSLGTFSYHRASKMVVETAGSDNHNVGELTLRHTSTTNNILLVMPEEHNQSQLLAYTVPVGKTLFISNFNVNMTRDSGSDGSANINVKVRDANSNVWRIVGDEEITNTQGFTFQGTTYFVGQEKQDIKVTVVSVSDNSTIVNGKVNGFLISNDT